MNVTDNSLFFKIKIEYHYNFTALKTYYNEINVVLAEAIRGPGVGPKSGSL